jgi:hypothetical protein
VTDDFLDDVLTEKPNPLEKALPQLAAAVKDKPEPPGLPLKQKPSIAKKKSNRPSDLVTAERRLKPQQRFFAKLLLECDSYAQAERAMAVAGYPAERTTLYRWRCHPDFVAAFELMQKERVNSLVVNKDKILSDAEKAKQIALNPKAILYKGIETGHNEVNVGAYIRALELQGKAIGVGGDDGQKVQVNIDIDYSGRVEGSADVIDNG